MMHSITHQHVAAKYVKDVSSTLISPKAPLDGSFHAAEPVPWWGAAVSYGDKRLKDREM
jgi:hypothetical protein